jgi:PAS domain S-box-containing protein
MQVSLPREQLLETLLAVSGEAVVYFDLEGVIVLWNAAATQLYGFAESEVLGKHVSMLLPLYELPAMEEILRSAHLMEHCACENIERLGKDGRRIPVRIHRAAVRDRNGETLGLVEQATEIFPGSPGTTAETHLRLLVEQMPVAFWTTDLKLRITSKWGSGFRRLRVFRGKPLEQTVYEYFCCRESEETPVKQHLGALRGVSARFEYQWRKRVFDISLEPLRNAEGAIIGCIGVALDITER